MTTLFLALSLVLAEGAPVLGNQAPERPPVPWYVPRTASLGISVGNAVAPHFRIGWELTMLDQPRNDLVLLVHVGSGLGVAALADGMTTLYQHALVGGLGYRMSFERWQWGFDVAVGALWYRAAYLPSTNLPFESRVQGYTEGAVRAGARLKPHLFVGGFVGLGTVWEVLVRFPGAHSVGGFRMGLYVDWR